MDVVAWVEPATWQAVVSALRKYTTVDNVIIVAVANPTGDLPAPGFLGLMGRARGPQAGPLEKLSEAAANLLLEQAQVAFGRKCDAHLLFGPPERRVVEASDEADLLVLARDGDRSCAGPKSIGKSTRFILDHALCEVLLVWPEDAAPLD